MLFLFKRQFVPKILNLSKRFTCRKRRKHGNKVGVPISMYTGPRFTPELITKEHTLKGMQTLDLTITFKIEYARGTKDHKVEILVDKRRLLPSERKLFYEYDGFDNEQAFVDFWTNNGKKSICEEDLVIYHWTDFRF